MTAPKRPAKPSTRPSAEAFICRVCKQPMRGAYIDRICGFRCWEKFKAAAEQGVAS